MDYTQTQLVTAKLEHSPTPMSMSKIISHEIKEFHTI